jgi:hypothetical protein
MQIQLLQLLLVVMVLTVLTVLEEMMAVEMVVEVRKPQYIT